MKPEVVSDFILLATKARTALQNCRLYGGIRNKAGFFILDRKAVMARNER